MLTSERGVGQSGRRNRQIRQSQRSKRLRVLGTAAALVTGALVFLTACATETSDPAGTWGEDDGPQLVLETDGSLHGTDGCNRLTGQWNADGDELSFGPVGATLMACEGVDTWLSGLATGTVDGDTLQIFAENGEEIGTLARQ